MFNYDYKPLISSIKTLNKWVSLSLRSFTYLTRSLTLVLFQLYLLNLFGPNPIVGVGFTYVTAFFKVFFPNVGVLFRPFYYALFAVVVDDMDVSLPLRGLDAERDLYLDYRASRYDFDLGTSTIDLVGVCCDY